MSVITCENCCKQVDTDFYPVEWFEGVGGELFAVCEACLDNRQEDEGREALGMPPRRAVQEGHLR